MRLLRIYEWILCNFWGCWGFMKEFCTVFVDFLRLLRIFEWFLSNFLRFFLRLLKDLSQKIWGYWGFLRDLCPNPSQYINHETPESERNSGQITCARGACVNWPLAADSIPLVRKEWTPPLLTNCPITTFTACGSGDANKLPELALTSHSSRVCTTIQSNSNEIIFNFYNLIDRIQPVGSLLCWDIAVHQVSEKRPLRPRSSHFPRFFLGLFYNCCINDCVR